ncbi:MAG: GNAT family protein [Exiguobacterium sp.]|uniref:GNAT family N-acetyltransferase n=1 Tax=Exiguobacterium acetylicum TaxID=41170 RepID=UPI003470B55C
MKKLLEGHLTRLTRFQPEDTEVMQRLLDDATFARHFSATPYRHLSMDKIEKMMATDAPETFRFAIRNFEDERMIGVVALEDILPTHGTAWLMIGIDPDCEGQGYATDALQTILEYAFLELNLYRIQLTVFDYNLRAIKLYERLGFVQEGRYRAFLRRDGERHDMLLYGLLEPEWRERQ